MKSYRTLSIVSVVLVLAVAAALIVRFATTGGQEPTPIPTPTPEPGSVVRGEAASIRSIDVLILESFPVQVQVNIQGDLPDACTTIAEITSSRAGNTFTVKVITQRPTDAMCAQVLVPFQQNVALDVYGLPAGEYTVVVYDKTATFTLTSDNIPPDEPTLTPAPSATLTSTPPVDACPKPGTDQAQAIFDDLAAQVGYCFLYPADFSLAQNDPANPNQRTLIVGPPHGEGSNAVQARLSIEVEDAGGRTLDEVIAAMAGDVAVVKTPIQIGGVEGVAVVGLPDYVDSRVVFVERNGWIFKLFFSPLQSDEQPDASADMERLFEMVIGTWLFVY